MDFGTSEDLSVSILQQPPPSIGILEPCPVTLRVATMPPSTPRKKGSSSMLMMYLVNPHGVERFVSTCAVPPEGGVVSCMVPCSSLGPQRIGVRVPGKDRAVTYSDPFIVCSAPDAPSAVRIEGPSRIQQYAPVTLKVTVVNKSGAPVTTCEERKCPVHLFCENEDRREHHIQSASHVTRGTVTFTFPWWWSPGEYRLKASVEGLGPACHTLKVDAATHPEDELRLVPYGQVPSALRRGEELEVAFCVVGEGKPTASHWNVYLWLQEHADYASKESFLACVCVSPMQRIARYRLLLSSTTDTDCKAVTIKARCYGVKDATTDMIQVVSIARQDTTDVKKEQQDKAFQEKLTKKKQTREMKTMISNSPDFAEITMSFADDFEVDSSPQNPSLNQRQVVPLERDMPQTWAGPVEVRKKSFITPEKTGLGF